jgi:hypothetical protein
MIDPQLIVDEFLFSLGGNIVTAILVGLLMLGLAVLVPRGWRWWAAYAAAVIVGLCLTVAFIAIGMRYLYRLGARFEVHFGPIHLAIAMLISGIGYAIVRRSRGPDAGRTIPKPDSWYER